MKKQGNAVFLVLLLLSVALIVGIALWWSKQNVEEVERISQMEELQEQNAQEIGDAMQKMQDDVQGAYDALDGAVP